MSLCPKSKFVIILLDFSPNPLRIAAFFLFGLLQFQATLHFFFSPRTLHLLISASLEVTEEFEILIFLPFFFHPAPAGLEKLVLL